MHHPGPPRFTAVGATIELAPRDPDPEGTYEWTLAATPADSDATLGSDPVVHFTPDAPGVYTAALAAPDGRHELTVRVFPSERSVGGDGTAESGPTQGSGVSGSGGRPGRAGGHSGSDRGSEMGDDDRGGGGRPRIQVHGERDGDEVVLTATPEPAPGSDRDADALDVEFYVDDRDDRPETLRTDDREVRVPVDALADSVRVHAVAVGDQYSVPDAVRVAADGSVERLNDPPAWATGMSLYEVYVRGYKDRDGDSVFSVVADNLDEIQELGVDTLWLTPILENDHADHGYNITDFFSIADDLGTEAEFEALVEAAHERDMKVLFDLVLNHSARTHPYFERAREGDETYRDWYEWTEDGTPGTYFDWEHIANFDYDTLAVRRHLLDAVDKWATYVDGFRCDMAWAVPKPFWQELRERLRARDPEFLLLDETVPYVADFHELAFDVHFDTTLYFTLRQIGRGEADADAIHDAIRERTASGFPDHAGFMLYVENHDETRYIEECGRAATEAAAAAQFTLPGVPMVYAGQEIGERNRRGRVYWEHAEPGLREYYCRLADTRAETPALGYHGDYEPVTVSVDAGPTTAPGEDVQVVAYAREADDRYVVVLNFGASEVPVSLPEETVESRDVVTGDAVGTAEADAVVENVVVLPVDAE